MFNLLKKIKFSFKYKDCLIILLSINLAVLIHVTLVTTGMKNIMSLMERQIQIIELDRKAQIYDLYQSIKKTAKVTLINSNNILEIKKYTKELEDSLLKANETMKKLKPLDLPNIENIKEANLLIYNVTANITGSGTHIKIKGNSYILTVAHLIDNVNDEIYGITNNTNRYSLIFEKLDKTSDLALFKIKGIEDLPYLEIGTDAPKTGSEIIIIGNPANMKDMVTEGVIAKRTKEGYIFTNTIFFGNSGGAILYKDKIVGVVSQLRTYMNFPVVYVNYGYGSNLKAIQKFLNYIKPY